MAIGSTAPGRGLSFVGLLNCGLLPGLAKVLAIVVGARLSGSCLRTPFFDAVSGAPIVRPQVLTAEQLAAGGARHSCSVKVLSPPSDPGGRTGLRCTLG